MDSLSGDSALASAAFGYVDFGVAHGLSRDALMAAAQLTEGMRADPDARCSPFAYVVLWQALITQLPGVCVPVELVKAMKPAALGVIGQVVLRADDLAHATSLIERFLRLADTALTLTRPERGDVVGFAVGHRPEVVAMRFPIELMIGAGYRAMSVAAGSSVPLREVTFAHPAGYPVAAYEELFGAPVRFEQPLSALWIPRDAMATPIAGRDPITRHYLEAQAELLLASLPATGTAPPLILQVRAAILDELAASGAELARVAKRVAMSTRTLQRRLEEAGTGYQDLVDEVRYAVARTLLCDRARSIIDVAFELGYGDLKSFYRAFRRWTDATPAEWRALHAPKLAP